MSKAWVVHRVALQLVVVLGIARRPRGSDPLQGLQADPPDAANGYTVGRAAPSSGRPGDELRLACPVCVTAPPKKGGIASSFAIASLH
jgi:hypothetical protein